MLKIIYDSIDIEKVIDIKGYPKGWPYGSKENAVNILNRIYT